MHTADVLATLSGYPHGHRLHQTRRPCGHVARGVRSALYHNNLPGRRPQSSWRKIIMLRAGDCVTGHQQSAAGPIMIGPWVVVAVLPAERC